MKSALDHKGKEFLFNFDQAQSSPKVKSEEILTKEEHGEPEFHSGLQRTFILYLDDSFNSSFLPLSPNLEMRSLSPPLWKSSLAVSGSRHRERSQKQWEPQRKGVLACPATSLLMCVSQTHWGGSGLPERPQTPERQDHSYLFLTSFPIPLAAEVDLSHRECPMPNMAHLLLLMIKMDRKGCQSPGLKNASQIES